MIYMVSRVKSFLHNTWCLLIPCDLRSLNKLLTWRSASQTWGPSMNPLPAPNAGYWNTSHNLKQELHWGMRLTLSNQYMKTLASYTSQLQKVFIVINGVSCWIKKTRQRLLQAFHFYVSLAIRAVGPGI